MAELPGVESQAVLNRLRWRCRRGMRELDQLLRGWLDANCAGADAGRLAGFDSLLDCEDSDLWAWFSGSDRPLDAGLARLVDEIRAAHRA